MTRILTITLNPALDVATTVDAVRPGVKLRCGRVRRDPGGGGVNVARAIVRLGGDSCAWMATGGPTGAQLLDLMAAEQVPTAPFALTGETRQNLAVFDAGGQAFRFSLPGPGWTADMVQAALDDLAARDPAGPTVFSGSLPPGVPLDITARLSAALPRAQLIVDVPTGPLRALVDAPPSAPVFALRMDAAEAAGLVGTALPDAPATGALGRRLIAAGVAEYVIIARGAEGSILVSADAALISPAPDVPVNSKIGAGDSFVAAFALALDRSETMAAALSLGTAAASAAVMTPGTALCTATDVARLHPLCPVRAL